MGTVIQIPAARGIQTAMGMCMRIGTGRCMIGMGMSWSWRDGVVLRRLWRVLLLGVVLLVVV